MSNLPKQFIDRLKLVIPDAHWFTVWNSFHIDKPLVIRINTLRTDKPSVEKELIKLSAAFEEVSWKDDALIIPLADRSVVLNSDIYQKGLLYSPGYSGPTAWRRSTGYVCRTRR
jgi:16S rRNA C967 or C1407 C5-methylase (RsmB/RsmF family)